MSKLHRPEKLYISPAGKLTILFSTAIALLATPLAAPAMSEIATAFAHQAQTEPFALAILQITSLLFGETDPADSGVKCNTSRR